MSATELKLEIINKVNAIDDELFLTEIYRMLATESDLQGVYKLSDEEIKAIQLGVEDINAGRLYSSEAARNKVKKWLKK